MKTQKFVRKPFYVEGVQVTAENMAEVAKWCQGDIRGFKPGGEGELTDYIKVRVLRPLNERQTMAFVGDWVLYAGTGYKVYTVKAFLHSFEKAPQDEVFETQVEELTRTPCCGSVVVREDDNYGSVLEPVRA